MIGKMLAKIRKDKGFKKKELAQLTEVDVSYLSHIEKGDRVPSYKVIKKICKVFNIPFQPLLYTYDKDISISSKDYDATQYISYNRILAIESPTQFIECPASVPSSSIAMKITDSQMLSTFDFGSYVYIEFNSPLKNKDIGLFHYNGSILIRHFLIEKHNLLLKSDTGEKIVITPSDDFYIIGKILR